MQCVRQYGHDVVACVNYYEHHIGDYAAATSHLTLVEDAIYSRLLRRYYLQESPLPIDVEKAARLAGARSPEEVSAAESVLREFFTLEADGWHNKRADEEIERYQDKQAKAKASAEARWSGKGKPNAKPSNSDGNADAMRPHTEGNAHQTPDTNTKSERDTPATPAGVLGRALRQAGCPSVAMSHPEFLAAVDEGVTAGEVTDGVEVAKANGVTGGGLWLYAVKTARKAHASNASEIVPVARAGPERPQTVGKVLSALQTLEGMKSGNGLDSGRVLDGIPDAGRLVLGGCAGR